MATDSEMLPQASEAEVTTPSAVPTSHPIGFWFFFWGEFAERSSYYGMRAVLALYMVERLGFDKQDGATIMSLFIAGCYLLPLVGGLIADNVLGKYWTIVGFSLPYLLGHVILGYEDRTAMFIALGLLAMGSGVIKPNISTLMGMTYDQQRPGQEQLLSNAFSWFYLAINIGAFIAQLGVPYVRNHYGYQLAFLFPTVLLAISLIIFAAGKRFYAYDWRDTRKVKTPEERQQELRVKWQVLGRISLLFVLVMFFWAIFDQSASTWIYFADTYMDTRLFGIETSADAIQAFNPLFIIVLLPINVALFNRLADRGMPVAATTKIALGFFLTLISMATMSLSGFMAGEKQEVIKISTNAGDLYVPFVDLTTISSGDVAETVPLGDKLKLLATEWSYDTEKKRGALTAGEIQLADGGVLKIRQGTIDFANSTGILGKTLILNGTLETKLRAGSYPLGEQTLVLDEIGNAEIQTTPFPAPQASEERPTVSFSVVDWVRPEERVTVWWQVLAYLILTMAEILISVTGLELAYTAAPAGMKSFVTACWLFTVFLANFLINTPITRLYPIMEPGVYFAMLAGAMIVVMILFIPISRKFNRTSGQVTGTLPTREQNDGP